MLNIRASADCKYDLVSLGEVMLRLDPGQTRIRTTRNFQVWEGGGEYNVARGLRKCFKLRTAIVTALVDNEVGRLIEDLVLQGGVATENIIWKPFDGVGRISRNGLNFTERGYGVRGALGVSDRGHSAISQLGVEDINWNDIFKQMGVRWFHTGGIFAALSDTSTAVAELAIRTAKEHGVIVSYDLNFRPSLWKGSGGAEKAREVNRRLAKYVDVMIGNEEDFSSALGYEIEGVGKEFGNLESRNFRRMIEKVTEDYPNFEIVATTLRGVKTASINDWGAIGWSRESGFVEVETRDSLEILDRVGGGDSFASGLIYGLLQNLDFRTSMEYGAAHGALAMTTPGDTSMASLNEVEALVRGASARVDR